MYSNVPEEQGSPEENAKQTHTCCYKTRISLSTEFISGVLSWRNGLLLWPPWARAQWVTSLYLHPQYNPDVVNWRAVWEMASGLKVCPKPNIQILPSTELVCSLSNVLVLQIYTNQRLLSESFQIPVASMYQCSTQQLKCSSIHI